MKLGIGSYTFTWAIGVPNSPSQSSSIEGTTERNPLHPADGEKAGEPEQLDRTCQRGAKGKIRQMGASELLQRAASLGVSVVQFCDNLPLDILSEEDLNRLVERAQDMQILIEVGTRGIHPQRLLQYLDIAERVGSPIVRTVIDTANHKPDEEEAIELIRKAVPDYERARILLAIENHDRFTSSALTRILERIGSPCVGICLDTVNSFGALEGPAVVLGTLAPWVVNLHIKDFVVSRSNHQMGFVIEGRPVGQGSLDIPWLLEKLRSEGRDPNAIIELWTPPEKSLEATIAKESEWAEESVRYLRRLIPD